MSLAKLDVERIRKIRLPERWGLVHKTPTSEIAWLIEQETDRHGRCVPICAGQSRVREFVFIADDGVETAITPAAPFRRDGRRMEGRILYNYPLANAQAEGYFRPIRFEEVWERDQQAADEEIAAVALERLRDDLAKGFDHIVTSSAYHRTSTYGKAIRMSHGSTVASN